jgi:C4-type Zn-finger protein
MKCPSCGAECQAYEEIENKEEEVQCFQYWMCEECGCESDRDLIPMDGENKS